MKKILIVDDDTAHRIMLKVNLSEAGYQVIEADDGDQVLPSLEKHDIDLILMDLKMKRMDGMEALALLREKGRIEPVVVITAFSSVESAVEAMKYGAMDYVTKPVDIEALKLTVAKALDFEALREENIELKKRLGEQFDFTNIIGRSPVMQQVFETLSLVAPSDAPVLITGETGTGKELVAATLHQNSSRRGKPFVKLNCGALSDELLESELFGHERGAFPGAEGTHRGRFEEANGGTLFLDEIGDMSLRTQAKILRVLQDGVLERLGGKQTIIADVRLVGAMHMDLAALVDAGKFRQDLYFSLSVVPIELPPLRDRLEDIPVLAATFLERYAAKNKKDIKGFHPQTLVLLARYGWPGNIRELENTIERAVILCLGEQITPQELPPQFLPTEEKKGGAELMADGSLTLKDMERETIRLRLARGNGDLDQTAELLGISREELLAKIAAYGL